MIGDPFRFAVSTDLILEWSNETWCNGVLLFCVDGVIYPIAIVNSTLNYELVFLYEKMRNVPINIDVYNLMKEDAFTRLYNFVHPIDWSKDNDYSYELSPPSLTDRNDYIFFVGNGNTVRILASRLRYLIDESTHDLQNIEVTEAFIEISELNEIATEVNRLLKEFRDIIQRTY